MDSEILRLFLSLVLNYLAPALLVTAGVVGVLQATGLGRERASGFLPPSDATRPAPERIATPH